jgi:putative MATE family efflux protein
VDIRPHPASIARLSRMGADLLVRTVALRVALAVSTAVAARVGTTSLAAHEIAFGLWSFLAFGLDAVAIAGQAMVGRALGAGDARSARGAGRRMIEWGVALGTVAGVGVLATRGLLPHVFSDDPAVIEVAGFLLVWVALLQPLNGLVFVLDGILIGAGDMAFLARAMVGAAIVFVPPAVAVAVLGLGIGWLWACIGLLMAARALALGARFAGDRWIVLGGLPSRR